MRLNRAAAGLIAVIMLTGLAACGGDDDPENGTDPSNPTESTSETTEPTEPTPTEPETTEPATDEDKAAAALLGYLEVRDEAYATGRISKKLNKFATGREHFSIQQFVRQLNTGDKPTRFEGEWSHEVLRTKQQGSDQVLVTDCEDGSDVEIVRDGTVLPWFKYEDQEIPRRLEQSYLVALDGDQWKVEEATSLPNKVKQC